MRKQFVAFRLLLGKAWYADCSALEAQWQKSRRAVINNNFSLSWLKLILQKAKDYFSPPLHQVSEESVIHNAAYQYLFYWCPSKAVCFQLPDRLFITGCPTVNAGLPMAALREGEAAGPAPHLNQSWPGPSEAAAPAQAELYSNMSPAQSQAGVLDRPWSYAISGWTPKCTF